MKKLKKLLAAFLCLALVLSAFAGCAGNTAGSGAESTASSGSQQEASAVDTGSDVGDAVEISIASWGIEDALSQGDRILTDIESRFGITIKPVNVTWDDYTEKVQLWAASDSLPDVFTGAIRTSANFYQWATQGLLKEIPTDLSAYPTLENYLNSPETDTCMVEGKVYCLFRQTYAEQSATVRDRVVAYRWDLAQEAGVTKEPETWEEFRDMMQKIIAADPDGKQVSGMTVKGYKQLPGIIFTYSLPAGMVNGASFYWSDTGDGTYAPAYFNGDAVSTFQLARDMYSEGTIEADVALTTTEQAKDKFLQGQSAAILTDGGFGNLYSGIGEYWKDIHETEFLDDVKALNLMPGKDGEKTYSIWDYAWSESYISAKVDDRKMDKILQLYDFLLSDEGAFLSNYGYEGEDFDFDADGTVQLLSDTNPNEKYKSIDCFAILARWNPSSYDKRFISTTPDEYIAIDDDLQRQAEETEMPEFDQRYTSIFVGLGSDFALNVEDDLLNVMTGTEDVEKMWEDIKAGYEAKGLSDVIEQVNEKAKELGYR